MRCTSCDTPIPEGAAFCISCGAPVAATGRTVALGEQGGPRTVPVATELPATVAGRHGRGRRRSLFDGSWRPMAKGLRGRSGALFMIGLGVLFFTNLWWPWILALIGLTGAVEELSLGGVREALVTMLFFGGLAVLFATGLFWPGILVLLGLVALVDRAA
jgi:hypothetical protein